MDTAGTSGGSPARLLESAVAADGGRPLVTYYDDATGERVELSVATVANWVAKTAGFLTDELGTAPGDAVHLALPPHWLQAVWALAVWRIGAVVDLGPVPPTGAGLLVCGPDGIAALDERPRADETVGVSLAPMGAPFPPGTLPPGVLDFARQVPVHPDRYDGPRPGADEPALRAGARAWTGAQAVAYAGELAAAWGVQTGGRLLAGDGLPAPEGLLAATVVPLAAAGSVVLVRHGHPAEAAAAAHRAEAERVTAYARGTPA